MNSYDENLIQVSFFPKEPCLGDTITAKFEVNESFALLHYKSSKKDIESRLSLETEWIIVDPVNNKFIKQINGDSLTLDESTFEKKIKAHSTPMIDKMMYDGMPFQKEFGPIDLNLNKLKEFIKTAFDERDRGVKDDVAKIYAYFAKSLHAYNNQVHSLYDFSFKFENIGFWFNSYKNTIELESTKKKLKYMQEDKSYLQSTKETQIKEIDKMNKKLTNAEKQLEDLKKENEYLLEEKNFFMSSSHFKSTQESSFLNERSNELTQSNILNFTAGGILPNIIPPVGQDFDFTIMDESANKELLNEKTDLEEKLKEYEQLIKNYRKEIGSYKKIYSQNKIDTIINENKKLKIKVNGLQNLIEEYKSKLLKFDFAYKYISQEFEKIKKFQNMFGGKSNDENFLMASKIVQNLTQELYEKNKEIDMLKEKVELLQNELGHNQTF